MDESKLTMGSDPQVLASYLAKKLQPHQTEILNAAIALKAAVEHVRSLAITLAPQLMSVLALVTSINWERAREALDALPERSKEAMLLAAKSGWYFGWDQSLYRVMQLISDIEQADGKDVDSVFMNHYQENLDDLLATLCERFPQRAAVISAGVWAHRSSPHGFHLSVPVFIAQADGIWAELTNERSPMAGGKDGKQQVKGARALRKKIGDVPESLDLLAPLFSIQETDFLMSEERRAADLQSSGKKFVALNRHLVMHGEASNYGTEQNSLKAFSLLAFVGVHLPAILERHTPPSDKSAE